MAEKVNLEELRENARTNYGITNAEDLDAETLQEEIDTIDKQAADAEKASAQEAKAADAEESDADGSTPLNKQNKKTLLATAEAEGVAVEDTDTVPALREKIQASRDERAAGDEDDDDEDEA